VTNDVCLACGSSDVRLLVDLPAVPVQSTALFASADTARAAPSGRLRLVGCHHCSAASNAVFRADLVPYDSSYENSQLFSPRFRAFAEDLSDDLVARHALGGGHVVEVGCGKGEFLALICTRGSMRGTGFDPTYDGEVDALGTPGSVRIKRTWFDERAADDPADVVCCRHVLEHIPEPVGFLGSIRRAMRPDTVLYLEVPNARFTFTESGLWDLIYQHCIYFTAEALEAAVHAAGFAVERQQVVFDEQFLALEATATDRPHEPRTTARVATAASVVDGFWAETVRFASLVDAWHERLTSWHEAGRRVALWGAGAKGVTFLNLTADTESAGDTGPIEVVVDVNERKQGHYLAGTGHRVDPPARLKAIQPDVVLIANRAYEAEIATALSELGLDASIESL
jgi:SAM-dependent methyltransferase